ncbi:MAG: hypothetical protein Q8P57_05420 [Candidatus Pacearchaeota archaeon]|nr:hypothetical protein [Candidatus Pacearchaeota archaeon]
MGDSSCQYYLAGYCILLKVVDGRSTRCPVDFYRECIHYNVEMEWREMAERRLLEERGNLRDREV